MENSTYRSSSKPGYWSPEVSGNMPESDFYPTWMDTRLQGNAPFSPVPSAYTLPTSDSAFSLGQSATQDIPMVDHFYSSNWSADRSYIDEPALSEHSLFPFHEHAQPEVMQAGYQSWFTPTEVNFEHYFQMDHPQGPLSGFTSVAPQTAGFVGSTPIVSSSQAGPSYPVGSAPGHFESAPASQQLANGHVASAHGPFRVFPRASQSPELTTARPPRRLSVAVHPQVAWTSEDADSKPLHSVVSKLTPGYGHGVATAPTLRGHRGSNASFVGSPGSVMSSAASIVGPAKIERSLSSNSKISNSAKSEDSEGKARSDPLYSTTRPRADGFYHCPYENCGHKPTKLKCNFE